MSSAPSLFPPDPLWLAVVQAVQAYCQSEHGRQATALTLHLSHGHSRRLPLPLVPPRAPAPAPRPALWPTGPCPKAYTDYQRVYWPGYGDFRFSISQGKAVRLLYEAWQDGTVWVGQKALLAAAGSDGTKMSDLFKRSEAWGTIIVRGEGALYGLVEPRAIEEGGPLEPRVVPEEEG